MRMRSRTAEQRRPGFATMALVFAGTLFAYLFATVIPASAATVCSSVTVVTANDEMALVVGTDDKVIVAPVAGVWNISINGGALAPCVGTATTAAVRWINVTGSDAGAETIEFYNPTVSFPTINTTVNLGNGVDTVIWDWAAIAAPVLPDTGLGANFGLGVAADGSVNGGSPAGTVGVPQLSDFRVVGPENMTVNGSNSLVSGDFVNLSDTHQLTASTITPVLPAVFTADDTLTTVSPVATGVTFNAGSGDDTLVSGDGADNFQGAAGADTVDYSAASAGVTADLTAATGTGQGNDTLADVQNITGSAHDDTLTGNTLDNIISGGDGADVIDGGTGNDTLNGGNGDDTFNEGAANNGHDTITGGDDVTEVLGDTLNYGDRTAAVSITAGGGPISGESGELDNITGGIENYITGSGNDTLIGDGGDEFFTPGSGTNSVDGAGGTDYLDMSTEAGPAVFDLSNNAGTGTAGATVDTFKHTEGLIGTDGDDTLNWDGTGTLLDFIGGAGTDTVDASTSALPGVTVDLTGFSGGLTHGTVENVIGGPGDDTIIGNQLYNTLTGGAGADILTGNDGNDTLDGGDGRDNINGGNGNDLVMGGTGDDTMNGGVGADSLVFDRAGHGVKVDNQLGFAHGQGSDSISFFEIIRGTDKADSIIGGQTSLDGNNRYFGFGGNDKMIGTNSTDVLNGGDGNDYIRGGNGDDILSGAAGNDRLLGSNGDDQLNGGTGNDWGWGGPGNDFCASVEHRNSC